MREMASSINLKDTTHEDFLKANLNFNLPHIGKLYVDYNKILKYKRQLKYYQNVKCKTNQTSRKSGTGD